MDDIQLLRQFADHQSEQAFTELVERHVDLVFSTAVRLVSNADLAKDVVQTVFTDLACHARKHNRITLVSGWLYRRTYYAAMDLLRSESSRRARERTAMALYEVNAPAPSVWPTVAPHLEEAMSRLSPADQDAVVLRYIENKSLREVGLVLGLSEDTAQKRVSRALERLRAFYVRRGVTISLSLLGSALASNAVEAASPDLAASVTATVVACSKGVGGGSLLLDWLEVARGKMAWVGITTAILVVPVGYTAFHIIKTRSRVRDGLKANLVQNSGFEDGTTFWKNTKGVLSATTAFAHSGTAAALVSERVAAYSGPIQQLPVETLQTDSRFICSAQVKILSGPPQPVQITIRYDDENGTHYLIGARGRAGADRWSEIEGNFVLQPVGTMNFVDLFLEGPAPGVDFLVDDVTVYARP